MVETTLAQLKEEKAKLQAAIAASVAVLAADFEAKTGMTPCSISVHMISANEVGIPFSRHIVSGVSVDVSLD